MILFQLSTAHTQPPLSSLSWSDVHRTFNSLGAPDNIADIASGKVPNVEEALERASRWTKRLGVSSVDGEAFVNGKWYELGDNFLRDLQNEAVAQMQLLQELVSVLDFCISPSFSSGSLPYCEHHLLTPYLRSTSKN
jgi:UDP-glucose:glycoprotein glucosyltransferase